ncbi:MAG TPA: family 16 glycoside hydrolase [Pirellulales bacterium]|jgi:type 1 glutamine amidotransferase|nr:family 16 glycoside hydrolase [Pirellulales bacterium]
MKSFWTTALIALVAIGCVQSTKSRAADDAGYESIFDGKTLEGWDGNPDFWRVEDGAITGETTEDNPTKGNTFLIWRGGEVGDFDLKVEFKLRNHNSGIQYRSFELPDTKWGVGGYQGDIDESGKYIGMLYGEKFRGILAQRGEEVVIGANHKPTVVGSVGDPDEILKHIKLGDWNEFQITAENFTFVHRINGHVTCKATDDDEEKRRASGIVALQLHQGPPMKVQFRNIQLKRLKAKADNSSTGGGTTKKIAFIAGKPSHGFGAHEHKAGCMLLAEAMNASGLPVKAEVYSYGWPEDASVLNDVDAIVCYADGGAKHPFNEHLQELDSLAARGVGMAFLHYGVEVPKSPEGDAFLRWMGGYFEADWSVNPHWIADYSKFPDHPISRGVKPFAINDEWYYHMRFRDGMRGVSPILTALPPPETLSRKDGPHSGNAAVRAAIARGEPQHMAWACERNDSGRGFGFTGGHYHWNWGHDQFRKLVLNAIAWTAKVDVPAEGVASKAPTLDQLIANQDEPVPAKFDRGEIQAMLDAWNGK